MHGKAKPKHVDKKSTNSSAIDQACEQFRKRLAMELENNPALHGSAAITVQISNGVIDRFRVTSDETQKCEAIPA